MWYSKKTETGSSEGKAQQGRKQEMIKQSIRIFCVEEIYDMVRKKEYSKDFLEYVKSAPNNIKEWLRKIGVDESLPEMRYIAEPEVHSAEDQSGVFDRGEDLFNKDLLLSEMLQTLYENG